MYRGVSRRAFLQRASVAATGVLFTQRLAGGFSGPVRGAGALPIAPWTQGHAVPRPVPALLPTATELTAPAIVTRAEWGADETVRRGATSFSPPRKIVVHHTALASTGDYAADVREVYKLHLTRDAASWSDVGYHYLVDPDGRVYEGRWARDYADGELHDGHDPFGRVVRGSHSMGFNTGTLGVALMGDFQGARPPDAMLTSLVDLLAWLCARHALDPAGAEAFVDANGQRRDLPNIMGHRDVRETLCPGQVTYDMIPDLRRRVAERVGPVAHEATTGYRILSRDGSVVSRGTADDLGDPVRAGVVAGFVSLTSTPTGQGVWAGDADGGIFTFGDARYAGSVPELRNSVPLGSVRAAGLARTPTGAGYWLLDRDGGVYAFGDASYQGSVPQRRAEGASIPWIQAAAIAPTPTGAGYWVLDTDGGVFTFGDARYAGSLPELRGQGVDTGGMPAVDLVPSASGNGYWILDGRGGVFSFGDAGFHGSAPQFGFPGASARRLVSTSNGGGYLVLCEDGAVLRFGDAGFAGHGPRLDSVDLALV